MSNLLEATRDYNMGRCPDAVMNQHDWVKACLARYEEEDLTPEPGGEWQEAHYPAPKGVGTDVIWLRFEDHQVQGLLQSEEYGRMCFFPHDTRTLLEQGSFVPGWFDLWGLLEKWASEHGKETVKAMNDHPNTRANRDKNALENARKMNEVIHTKKDEQGRSIAAVKAAEAAHAEKDEQGRSLVAMTMNEVIHAEKDDQGRSIAAVRAGVEAGKKAIERQSKRILLTKIGTGEVLEFSSAREAVRALSLNQGSLCSVARGEAKQHRGYTAVYLDEPLQEGN